MKYLKKIGLASALATLSVNPAFAQEAMSLDQRVNEIFAATTGPFVSLIFAPFPGTTFP